MKLYFVVYLALNLIVALIEAKNVFDRTSTELLLKVAALSKSKARSFYSSDEHFGAHFSEYISRFQVLGEDSQKVLQQKHAYIVRFPENCAHVCHSYFIDKFGDNKHSILNEDIGVVTASHHELQQIRKSDPEKLYDFVPLHPELKIDAEIRRISEEQCKDIMHGEEVVLTVSTHELTKGEYNAFEAFMKYSHKRESKIARVDIEFPRRRRGSNMYFSVAVKGCDELYKVALTLAHRAEIVSIEIKHPMYAFNRWSKGICDIGDSDYTPLINNNFTGDGEVIGVSDTGIDMDNCYFYDPDTPTPFITDIDNVVVNTSHRKVIGYVAYSKYGDREESGDGHGTHVAGTIAGLAYKNYGDYKKFAGMSYDAKIFFYDLAKNSTTSSGIEAPGNLNTELFQVMYEAGARIMSNSWGSKTQNGYTSAARQVDDFMYNFPDALVLFAAGNEGSYDNPVKNLVGSPATNKNGLTVGAHSNDLDSWKANYNTISSGLGPDAIAYFTSQGPTQDNRLKPDVLAPGYFVFSAKGSNNTNEYFCEITGKSGTSMATPTAAGYITKIREYFMKGYYPTGKLNATNAFTPSGALLKAMTIHSAQPMLYVVKDNDEVRDLNYYSEDFSSYPSYWQGYGRIQMNKVLNFGTRASLDPPTLYVIGNANKNGKHYAQLTNTGLVNAYKVNFITSSDPGTIRVTMCYTDPAPADTASTALVNSLVVYVTDSTGSKTYMPYRMNNEAYSNAQVIDLSDLQASSTYIVYVRATSLPRSPQPFALVITGDLTYLDKGEEVAQTETYSNSISAITPAGRIYIGVICGAVVFLMLVVWYVRRTTAMHGSIEMNPKNFSVDGEFDDDDDPNTAQNTSRNAKKNQKRSLFTWTFGQRKPPQPSEADLYVEGDYEEQY